MKKITRLTFVLLFFVISTIAGTGPRHLIDAKGNPIEIPEVVTRVAANGAINQIVLLLGARDKLVATSVIIHRNPMFVKIFPGITSIPAAFAADRKSLNLEELLAAHPQVVFGRFPQLKGTGIIPVELDLTTPDKIKQAILLVGQILGEKEEQRAKEYIQYYDANMQSVLARTSELAPDERPLVYLASGQDGLTSEGASTITDEWITIAGGRNLAVRFPVTQKIALENIIAANPDIIIVNSAIVKEKIMADSKWAMIKAVKTGHIYTNPKGVYLWSVRSGEGALQFLWSAKIIHPELFVDLDIASELASYYDKYYNYHLSDAEINSILTQQW